MGISWSMIVRGLVGTYSDDFLSSPMRDFESFDDEDESGSSDEELDDPQRREQMPGLGPSNEDDYKAWVPESGSSDEQLDDPSRGMTLGPEFTSHVDNLMQTYRDVKLQLASLHDDDDEQETGLLMEITPGVNKICRIMGDLQELYCLENPLRKKTSLDVNEVCKVVGDLCSICMKPPNSQNISQEAETELFTLLLLRRHVMTEENVMGEHLPISVDVEDQDLEQEEAPHGEAQQGDVPQGNAPQGDAPQGDAAQGDAAQGEAPQEDAAQGEAPQGDAAQGDAAQGDAAQGEAPQEDAAQEDAPQGDAAQGDAAQGEAPQGDAAQGEAPQEDAPQASDN